MVPTDTTFPKLSLNEEKFVFFTSLLFPPFESLSSPNGEYPQNPARKIGAYSVHVSVSQLQQTCQMSVFWFRHNNVPRDP